jgi:uncharacterized membrane protein YgcG
VLQTIIDVFRSDLTGMHAQTLVRLIARMIKERKFQVHPNILSAFLQLRLRKELDGMRDGKKHRGGGKEVGDEEPEEEGEGDEGGGSGDGRGRGRGRQGGAGASGE